MKPLHLLNGDATLQQPNSLSIMLRNCSATTLPNGSVLQTNSF